MSLIKRSSGGSTIGGYTVTITDLLTGQTLYFNGSEWVNQFPLDIVQYTYFGGF